MGKPIVCTNPKDAAEGWTRRHYDYRYCIVQEGAYDYIEDGYILVAVGEIIQNGDEFVNFYTGDWEKFGWVSEGQKTVDRDERDQCIGDVVEESQNLVRRRVVRNTEKLVQKKAEADDQLDFFLNRGRWARS